MHPSALLLASLLPSTLALAQYGGSSDSSSTSSAATSSSTGTATAKDGVHIVRVGQSASGQAGLIFEPNDLKVPTGDTVEFHFWPQAHSVAQSTFAAPCQPVNASTGGQGFFSGPVKVASGMSPTTWSVKVNGTDPIWFYCATGKHCQGGRVGVINAP